MIQEKLPFRALDNSTSTRMGYNLEVQHWLTSVKSAQASTSSGFSALGIIGFFLSIAVHIVLILIVLTLMFLEWAMIPSNVETVKNTHKPKYLGVPDEDPKKGW